METKLLELRDRATMVPVVCVKVAARSEAERFLLRHSGYGLPSDLILMGGLAGGKDTLTCDPYDWGGNGTRTTAHVYIAAHWDELESGQVICTEFIRGERETPKVSERLQYAEGTE